MMALWASSESGVAARIEQKVCPVRPGVGPVAMEERGAVPGTEPELMLYPAGDELSAEGRPLRDVEAVESGLGGRRCGYPPDTTAVRRRLWVTVREPRDRPL